MQIDFEKLMNFHGYSLPSYLPPFIHKFVYKLLNKIIKTEKINDFLRNNSDKYKFDFIDELFDYLDFSYSIKHSDKYNIPSEGKLICVANHPLGALDALALIRAISEVRKDVLVVANDLLSSIDNLKDLFLDYNVFNVTIQKANINSIHKAIENDCAVIFFPAAVVSRFTIKGIKDGKWQKGAIKLALNYNAPILPVHINAKNSFLFYLVSLISKRISMLMLPREVFNKRGTNIAITFGNLIPATSLKSIVNININTKLLKKHVYKLNKKGPEIFKTEKTIIHPIDAKVIVNELLNKDPLNTNKDGKSLYCLTYKESPNCIKEIARLREITFRKVGEGTGEKFDFDKYDKYYKHIVLYNDKNLDIIGSYRIGYCREILEEYGVYGLYNSDEFVFKEEFVEILPDTIEMGRSFIQPKYWKSTALDNLWLGIGIYVNQFKNIKYMYGAVSLSNTYPDEAKALIVYYYTKWYGSSKKIVEAKNPFRINQNQSVELDKLFDSKNAEDDYKILKSTLNAMGLTVPVLFRRYTELCENGGVKFIDFNIDANFSNCVDGFVILEISKIKQMYKTRYKFEEDNISDEIFINQAGQIILTNSHKTTADKA